MRNDIHYFEDPNLSLAWGRAIRVFLERAAPADIAPLVVSATGFTNGVPTEDTKVRSALDAALARAGEQPCHTVANTIFPASLWNPKAPRAQLYQRYADILPSLKKASRKNTRGMYFERLITGGPSQHPNQLEFILANYKSRAGVRRGALQVAVFDPKLDQSKAARLGFPCLQHVTFAPTEGGLAVNGFYATQYAFTRAYGNYLGLCRLGHFVAHELGIRLIRMTCFTGIMMGEERLSRRELRVVADAIDSAIEKGPTHVEPRRVPAPRP